MICRTGYIKSALLHRKRALYLFEYASPGGDAVSLVFFTVRVKIIIRIHIEMKRVKVAGN